jgi:hypothetical protein
METVVIIAQHFRLVRMLLEAVPLQESMDHIFVPQNIQAVLAKQGPLTRS